MRIRWERIIALGLIVTAVALAVRNRAELAAFLGSVGQIGPTHSLEDKTVGLIAFGLIVFSVLAAIRLTQNSDGKGQP